ncbi:glycine--tRNA ligase subunit beta [Asticcacaulis sp. ZE23SCel15]|uniref:glycine--tRNA ligase subunit beta n=1 Tax=Asticcacaulis sp. ZE23SCel15 TaxID=3059027 RepID=UPI00265F65A1|nr:glycine--tRNA ligase subunit beta [Asticcacaulis sp. ZE23SCel15]WKL56301.1 glycine--tRNA ligase subunit beta [Asticcacaulis sp. ZE23SCel15]
MPQLLIELFSEEIPARMQLSAARDFERLFDAKLKASGLSYETLKAYVGPRRMVLHVEGLPLEQAAVSEEVNGPREGAPPQALEGFLRKTGLTVDKLVIENGVYIARIEKAARKTTEVLGTILEDVILNFPWPKSMRSGTSTFRWVRPLKRIIFLFNGKVIPFELEGITGSNVTEGHRFLGSKKSFKVSDFDSYKNSLTENFVILDHYERQNIILSKAREACTKTGLTLIDDQGLLEEVAGLSEWPTPLLGNMDPKFLTLPPEVIKTSMKTHQKYFAVKDNKSGKMAPHFVVVSNMAAADGGEEIKRGNAKVLSARLSDGVFFWSEDNRAGNFDAWLEKLKGVTFHAKLGTLYERVQRLKLIAEDIAPLMRADVAASGEAARLAKADLASYMVGEFPELQGVMGGYYSVAAGHRPEISEAVRDHYKPQGPSDTVPAHVVAATVALADKIDTLVGFFAIDEKPTGSKDPYALRRAALGVLRILREHCVRASLSELVEAWYKSTLTYANADRAVHVDTENWRGSAGPRWAQGTTDTYENYLRDFKQGLLESPIWVVPNTRDYDLDILFEHVTNKQEIKNAVLTFRPFEVVKAEFLEFFADRLKVQLRDEGVRFDLIDAVFALKDDDVIRMIERIRALESIIDTAEGQDVLALYKRVANILNAEAKKGELPTGHARILAGAPEVETDLIARLSGVGATVRQHIEGEAYLEALKALSTLRGAVDAFLDGVLVNAEDASVRQNRLALLGDIRGLVESVADLSKITQ